LFPTYRLLSSFDGQRANNFTAIRLLFAYAVLFGHSYPISGNGMDPISALMTQMWIGEAAVLGFFSISGFLICASFLSRSIPEFVSARLLRLYPGFIVCLVVTALVLGPIDNTMTLVEYYSSPDVYRYIFINAPIWDLYWNIPNHAPNNPFPGSTNGATWTLPAELLCYFSILVVGFFGALDTRFRANVGIIALAIVGWFAYDSLPVFGAYERFDRPAGAFLVGVAFWINRRQIPLHWSGVILAVAVIYLTNGTPAWWPGYMIASAYLIFYAAYMLPHLDLDRFGDISYGVYIYAWPIQQLVWWDGQSGAMNALCATPIVFGLAIASWFLVERPALSLRKPFSRLLGLLIPRAAEMQPRSTPERQKIGA
jgi:peptidoglycan/LPS O-acetylase OafA/YrhL